MNVHILLAAFSLLLVPVAFGHGTAPDAAHSGRVVEDSAGHWVELVISGEQLTVYMLDDAQKPIPSAELGGKATVLVGSKSQVVTLTPAGGNSLAGKLTTTATGKLTTILSLTVSGKPAQARFAPKLEPD